LAELRGRDDDREHSAAADAGEARLVGDAEARRAREAFEMHRRREADAGTRDENSAREEIGRSRGGASLSRGSGPFDARPVVRHRDLYVRLAHPQSRRLGERRLGGPREHDLIDLHAQKLAAERRIVRASDEDLLGHRAGRIACFRAHERRST
jgi:hypothetical protein